MIDVDALIDCGAQGKDPTGIKIGPMKHCPRCLVESTEDRCFVWPFHRMKPGRLVRGVEPVPAGVAGWPMLAAWQAWVADRWPTPMPYVREGEGQSPVCIET